MISSRISMHCLAAVLFVVGLSPFQAFAQETPIPPAADSELFEAKGYRFRVEGSSLISWEDDEFQGEPHLGGAFEVPPGDGIARPGKIRSQVQVGVFPFTLQEDPSWKEKIEWDLSYVKSDGRPHVIDLVLTGKNKTKERISFRKVPFVLWVGPVGTGDTRYEELRGFQSGSLTTLTPKEPVPDLTRWISWTDRYRAVVLEHVDGPGRFLVEQLPVQIPQGEKPALAAKGNFLLFQPLEELQGEESFSVKLRLFAGLRSQAKLHKAGYGPLFDMYSGFFGWLRHLIILLLASVHQVIPNWGLAILLMTLVVKVVLHPLSRKQHAQMEKMKALQPRMREIQTRYANNPQKQQQEVANFMAKHELNPLAGCLPMLMQLPIFIALYTCLSYAPELRGVDFLWLPDLSKPDPFWLLPLLFSMGIYFSSAGQAQDETSATMMKVMPLVMFFIMTGLPAGVMLYLAGQTIFGWFEQRWIKASLAAEKNAPRPGDDEDDDGASGPETVVGNDEAEELRKKGSTGNKYKQKRKNRGAS